MLPKVSGLTSGKSGREKFVMLGVLPCRVAAGLAQQVAQEAHGSVLAQGLVPVAALGRLYASWASPLARATNYDAQSVAGEGLEGVVAAAGDADPAGVAIVDEDRREPALAVDRGGEAADVRPVAHREEGEKPDHAVFPGVQGPAETLEARSGSAGQRRQRHPEGLRLQDHVRKVEREDPYFPVVRHADLLVVGHGVRRAYQAPVERRPVPELPLLDLLQDLHVRLDAWP